MDPATRTMPDSLGMRCKQPLVRSENAINGYTHAKSGRPPNEKAPRGALFFNQVCDPLRTVLMLTTVTRVEARPL